MGLREYSSFFFSDYGYKPHTNPEFSRKQNELKTKFSHQGIRLIQETENFIIGRKENKTVYFFYSDNNVVLLSLEM